MSCGRYLSISNSSRSRWNSLNRQWLEFELTLYNILSPATLRGRHKDKKFWSGKSLATEYTWRLRSWRWHSTPENSSSSIIRRTNTKLQRRYTEVCKNIRFTTSKYQFSETLGKLYSGTWSLKVSFISNVQPGMSRLGPARIETPDKTKSPWGGFTALDLLTTKALVLLGFSIMHQWLHHSWILSKSPLINWGSNSGTVRWLADYCHVVWSHIHRHMVCSQPAEIFRL